MKKFEKTAFVMVLLSILSLSGFAAEIVIASANSEFWACTFMVMAGIFAWVAIIVYLVGYFRDTKGMY